MAFKKKGISKEMVELAKKIAGMKAIDPNLDLGNGITVAEAEAVYKAEETSIETYNSSLAVADENKNDTEVKNKDTKAFSKKILPAVGLEYGTDSDQYEMAGGVRESERKKPVRKPKVG